MTIGDMRMTVTKPMMMMRMMIMMMMMMMIMMTMMMMIPVIPVTSSSNRQTLPSLLLASGLHACHDT